MLQTSFIREHKKKILIGLDKRYFAQTDWIDEILMLDEKKRKTQFELDVFLARSNQLSSQIGNLFKSGQKDEAETFRQESMRLKEEAKILGERLTDISGVLSEKLIQIPNIPSEQVKKGQNADDNEIVHQEGDIPSIDDTALPHWELAKKFQLFDFELGTKLSGAGFPVYIGRGARLQRSLIQYFLDQNTQAGYLEYSLPHLVNEDSGYATGQIPDKEGQMYHIKKDDLYLIPTGEVPLINCYRGRILSQVELPIKATTHTPCFRREAGSYGAHVRGLNRLHQFDKVEIVQITTPEASYTALDEMVEYIKGLLRDLGLPFRILQLCGGDMGFTSAMTYDFEVYTVVLKKWLEVSSVSNCTDFQTHRLRLRYYTSKGKICLCHTLNGSALALPRILATLLENNQTTDQIKVPKVLVPYTGFDTIVLPLANL
ncbi:MAG: serine--tRNA ligase [Flavobacteriales bacterium AspAUS03]